MINNSEPRIDRRHLPEVPEDLTLKGTEQKPFLSGNDEPFLSRDPELLLCLKEFLFQQDIKTLVATYLYYPLIADKFNQLTIEKFVEKHNQLCESNESLVPLNSETNKALYALLEKPELRKNLIEALDKKYDQANFEE